MNDQYLTSINPLDYVSKREGEIKLGEGIGFLSNDCDSLESAITNSSATHVILGVPEDIGPRANLGSGGANHAWKAFLSSFLNMQENQFLDGSTLLLLGSIKTDDLQEKSNQLSGDIQGLRTLVETLDERVFEVAKTVFESGKRLIVIGGGHNNAYPLIKAAYHAINPSMTEAKQSFNVVNLDPHGDFRKLEGRHSGNGFSYAFESGFLNKYAILGLHEQYNSQYMLEHFEKHNQRVMYHTFEDMLRGKFTFNQMLQTSFDFVSEGSIGVELDMDSIAGMPTSAYTPSGISMEQARQYVLFSSKFKQVMYLHLCEAAPKDEKERKHVGKGLGYLVADFVKF
jgi:formiminoglutamase